MDSPKRRTSPNGASLLRGLGLLGGFFGHAVLAGSLLIGCSAAPPPPAKKPPPPQKIDRGPTEMSQEIGGLNQEAMNEAFFAMFPAVQRCVSESGTAESEVVGGEITLSLRIKADGSPRWVYLKKSSLGDRESEKCVMELALGRDWPKPLGGEGLAESSYEIVASREPMTLEAKRIERAIRQVAIETARCRHPYRGKFSATAYLKPNGRVLAAGVAPPSEEAEEASDCVVEAIERLRFGPMGRRPAKVSFNIP